MGFGGNGSGGGSVAGSSDVALSGPANNEVLTYDSTSSKWKNAVVSGGVSGPITVESLPAGVTLSLLFTGGVWPARPTERTDILVQWIDNTGNASVPEGALVGDIVIRDVS